MTSFKHSISVPGGIGKRTSRSIGGHALVSGAQNIGLSNHIGLNLNPRQHAPCDHNARSSQTEKQISRETSADRRTNTRLRPRNASTYGPLLPNVTSYIKPEVRNVSQRLQRRTEPRPQGICTKQFAKIGTAVPDYDSGQTDRWTHRRTHRRTHRQTDKLIAIHRSPTGTK